MQWMGFSINNLTLFGLVLAMRIVFDDAIVVLENIERWPEKDLSVREATIGATKEITGRILAITLVLSSVLLPSAFLGGITSQFFRQFALTISVAMVISALQRAFQRWRNDASVAKLLSASIGDRSTKIRACGTFCAWLDRRGRTTLGPATAID